jgi:hypothetical protein
MTVYADAGLGDDVEEIIASAKRLQSISSYTGQDILKASNRSDHEDRYLRPLDDLFEIFKKSDTLMFPYELSIVSAIDQGLLTPDEYGYRIDGYKLAISGPPEDESLYARDAIRFHMGGDNAIEHTLNNLFSDFAGVAKYFRWNNPTEILLYNVTKDQVAAFCDAEVGDYKLTGAFVEGLLRVANAFVGNKYEDLASMICVEWASIVSAGGDLAVFRELNEALSDSKNFVDAYPSVEFEYLDSEALKEVLNYSGLPAVLEDIASDAAESLKDEGFDDEDLWDAVLDIISRLILNEPSDADEGYWRAVLDAKLKVFQKDLGGGDMREVYNLVDIVRESKAAGAAVLEVGMSLGWDSALEFLLDPAKLLIEDRISVEDSFFYDEAY